MSAVPKSDPRCETGVSCWMAMWRIRRTADRLLLQSARVLRRPEELTLAVCDDSLARDLGFFRQMLPDRLPLRHLEAELLAEAGHLRGERGADLVVVTQLEL